MKGYKSGIKKHLVKNVINYTNNDNNKLMMFKTAHYCPIDQLMQYYL